MKRFSRTDNAINASSMADVAFLLLIFFLVTTTITMDKGILAKLPPWSEDTDEVPVPKRNTLVVLLNSADQVLVNGEPVDVVQLRSKAISFLNNRGADQTMSDHPRKAIISLQNDRGTSYGAYLLVQNELKAAYRELRDTYAQQLYHLTFEELKKHPEVNRDKIKTVADEYPMRLSEAEPYIVGGL